MLHVECRGSPYEIGQQHGSVAKEQVAHSVEFYKALFQEAAGLSWADACDVAVKFLPLLEGKAEWRELVDEMMGKLTHGSTPAGLAEASSQPFPSILALNTRTEIVYGLQKPAQSDGCTALSWHTGSTSLLGQNWDREQKWRAAQSPALISLRIHPASPSSNKPSIHMVTEAGIIGKIGLSTSRVGVCLNAIRQQGVSYSALPVHLALRIAMECRSAKQAVDMLTEARVASACHILVGDPDMAVGLECSANQPVRQLQMDHGIVGHTNHYILPLPDTPQTKINGHSSVPKQDLELPDSIPRLARLTTLVQTVQESGEKDGPSIGSFEKIFEDEQGAPGSICRFQTGEGKVQTLFGIVMDLKGRKGSVRVGRPSENGERVELDPWIGVEG
ncbi:MAG: hypothetical protein M4579_005002 [Chaenotheca gracillima]|nr:MAG: hypothetical protein M4579_005002 [Chaenotheca gracillima]